MGSQFSTPEQRLFASLEWSDLLDYVVAEDLEQQGSTHSVGNTYSSPSSPRASAHGAGLNIGVYNDRTLTIKEWQAFLSIFSPHSYEQETGNSRDGGDGNGGLNNGTMSGAVAMCAELISSCLRASSSSTFTRSEDTRDKEPRRSTFLDMEESKRSPVLAQDRERGRETHTAPSHTTPYSSATSTPREEKPSLVSFHVHHLIIPVLVYLCAFWRKEISRKQFFQYVSEAIQYQELIDAALAADSAEMHMEEASHSDMEENEEVEEEIVVHGQGKRRRVWGAVKGIGTMGVEQWRRRRNIPSMIRRTQSDPWQTNGSGEEQEGSPWDHGSLFRAATLLCLQLLRYEADQETDEGGQKEKKETPQAHREEEYATIPSSKPACHDTHPPAEEMNYKENEQLCYDAYMALRSAAGAHSFFRVCAVLVAAFCAIRLPYWRLMDAVTDELRVLWKHVHVYLPPIPNTSSTNPTGSRNSSKSDHAVLHTDDFSFFSSSTSSASGKPTTQPPLQGPSYYASGCRGFLCLLETALIAQQLRIQAMNTRESHALCASMEDLSHQSHEQQSTLSLPFSSSLPLAEKEESGGFVNYQQTPPHGSATLTPASDSKEENGKNSSCFRFSPSTWDRFRNRYVGQDAIWNALRTHFSTMNNFDIEKPTVILLFGPSGLGKSELAKCLASALHGIPPDEIEDSGKLVHIHMPSFCTQDSIYSLIDPPAAHVGDGILLSALLQHPDAVVVLDEFEKSTTSAVQHLWLSAFQKQGSLRSLKVASRCVKTTKTTFVLTCNLVADSILEGARVYLESGEAKKMEHRQRYVQQCRQACRELLGEPFVNRVDFFFPVLPYRMEERRTFILHLLVRLLSAQRKKGRYVAVSTTCVQTLARQQLTTFHATKVEDIIRQHMMPMIHHGWTRAVLTAVKGIQEEDWEYVVVPVRVQSAVLHSCSSECPWKEGCDESMGNTHDALQPHDSPFTMQNKRIYWDELEHGKEWLQGWFPPLPSPPTPCVIGKEMREKEKVGSEIKGRTAVTAAEGSMEVFTTSSKEEENDGKEEEGWKKTHSPSSRISAGVEGSLRRRHGEELPSTSPGKKASLNPSLHHPYGEPRTKAVSDQGDQGISHAAVAPDNQSSASSPSSRSLLTVKEKDIELVPRACELDCETEKERMLQKENNLLRSLVKEKEKEIEKLKKKAVLLQTALGVVLLTLLGFSLLLSFAVGLKVTVALSAIHVLILTVILRVPLRVLWKAIQAVYTLLGPARFFGLCCLIFSFLFMAQRQVLPSC